MDNIEARFIAHYLLKTEIDTDLSDKYKEALNVLNADLSKSEERLLNSCLSKPYLFPFVDAGLALIHPLSNIRKRIYIMFCLLETSERYADYFLPEEKKIKDYIHFVFDMTLAVFHSILGFIYLKISGYDK